MPQLLDDQPRSTQSYSPTGDEQKIVELLRKRIPVLKDTKKRILENINFEEIMKGADQEYMPHNLREKKVGSVMLIQDEIKGLRGSRIVPITGQEGQEWRSDVSEPTLLTKIQTAISILIDQNPEAVFKATMKKYKTTSSIAQAIWKRSWDLAQSKEQLKTFIFNLAKYGWAPARTYPRIVQHPKEILTELDVDHPENNKYKTVTVTEFNDIYREALDPWRTWMDDMANLYDPFSLDDWYFEKDFSRDAFDIEFGMYENADKVSFGALESAESGELDKNQETEQRDDVITLGFYESKKKDLYVIWSPADDVCIYYSPLPNDDGMLSLWESYWNMRDPRTRYGIGLFEILKNNKVMYDRLDNMDMDQLVLSIYTMLFYSGSNQLVGDGNLTVSPGLMKQKLPGTTVDQVKIDYSGKGREGARAVMERIDEITGITPTLQGQVEGKTLGEILHAKDAALKRLNIPLANIAHGLEADAQLTLSWANQVYSVPEVMEFLTEADLLEFQKENDREPSRVTSTAGGRITADFPRILELSLNEDRDGTLIESPESRFFTVGQDIDKTSIKWKGRVTVVPQSIVASSEELDRQRKLELFNLVYPTVQAISMALGQKQFSLAMDLAKPVVQILEIQHEKPEEWLPEQVVLLLNNPEMAKELEQQAQAQAVAAQKGAEPLFVDGNGSGATPSQDGSGAPIETPTAPSEVGPQTDTVVPKDQITNPVADTLSEIGKVK